MKPSTQKLYVVAANPWFLVVSGASSIAAFMWFVYDKYSSDPGVIPTIVLVGALTILFAGYVYSVRVRSENIALRGLSEVFYEINQIYRDKLRELFCSESPVTDPENLLAEEELALKGVCQRVENIFSRVLNRNCMVTVKLVTTENGKCFAHTYVRSQELCLRDNPERVKYVVGSGENTGFDEALAKRSDGLPPHFFSADLKPHSGGYSNQRQHFDRHYRSTIVVPIRGVNKGKESTAGEFDLIGFLCVDTMSINRLNNGYHLFMLAALANQMYNFMSLMRGKYTVTVR